MPRRPRLCAVLLVSAALAAAAPALAQPGSLDPTAITAQAPSEAQQQAIREYPSAPLRDLGSDDPAAIRAARARLLEPLQNPQASVRFRQLYSDAIAPALARNAEGKSDRASVNALRILGELATPAAIDALEARLADPRLAVRYAAVAGLERSLASIRVTSPAITQDRVNQTIAKLGERLAAEADPDVAGVLTRALGTLFAFERAGFDNVRPLAISTLAAQFRAKLPGLKEAPGRAMLPAMLTAAVAARDALTNSRLPLTDTSRKDAAEVQGHAFAYVFRAVRNGELNDQPDARAIAAQVVAAAEAGITVASGNKLQPLSLADSLKAASAEADRDFSTKGVQLLQALNEPPLAFAADHFIK
jgi:hypothetical protein